MAQKKKKEIDFNAKRVREKKETILIPVSVFQNDREVIETVRRYGKDYVKVKNI